MNSCRFVVDYPLKNQVRVDGLRLSGPRGIQGYSRETIMLKPSSMGSISHGTLRDDDLVEAFYNELEWQLQRQDRTPEDREEINRLHDVLGNCGDECWTDDGSVIDDPEILGEYVNETLPNALDHFSPPYCYFGSHVDDGSDFGFWPCMEEIDELPSYPSVDAAIEAGEEGDFTVISDHGNVEIYSATGESILGIV